MKNLKIIFVYNKILFYIGLLLIVYIIVFTKIITYKSKYDINETKISGVITSFKLDGNKLTLNIRGKEKVIGNYYIDTFEEKSDILNKISIGDKVLLEGSLSIPSSNTIPNTFNYQKYLMNKKIYYIFNIDTIKVIENGNMFYKIKDKLIKKIYKTNNSDYYLAFLVGDKTLLTSEIYNTYQKNGINHLLAISGMHINTLILVISFFTKKLNLKKDTIITSLVLLFFLFLTGISPSIIRTIIYFILKRINKIFSLNYSNLHILFITLYIILFFDPFMIYDIGFIYSFVVTFGIIYYSAFIKKSALKLSLVTFLFSLPITIAINYEFNLTSILINIIFIPLISLVVYPLSLISFIIPIFNPIFNIVVELTNFLNLILSKFSIMINIPKMSIILIILYYLVLLLRKRFIYLFFILFISRMNPLLDSSYYIYYLDVSQGDASILVSPYKREVVMIDTGGKINYYTESWQVKRKSYNLSDNTIKFLKSLGIRKIDYLIISHGDLDHAGEALNIINNLKVKNITLNKGSINSLEEDIIKTNVKVSNTYNLTYFKIYNLNDFLYDNENDNSIVSFITFLNYKLLYMGDASITVEDDLIKKYNIKNIDILKIGHHGSSTSTSAKFINYTKPKYSIISVGKNNSYGHPNNEVINNLSNSKIYRTDNMGSIIFKIRKNKLKIKTMA